MRWVNEARRLLACLFAGQLVMIVTTTGFGCANGGVVERAEEVLAELHGWIVLVSCRPPQLPAYSVILADYECRNSSTLYIQNLIDGAHPVAPTRSPTAAAT